VGRVIIFTLLLSEVMTRYTTERGDERRSCNNCLRHQRLVIFVTVAFRRCVQIFLLADLAYLSALINRHITANSDIQRWHAAVKSCSRVEVCHAVVLEVRE